MKDELKTVEQVHLERKKKEKNKFKQTSKVERREIKKTAEAGVKKRGLSKAAMLSSRKVAGRIKFQGARKANMKKRK